MRKAEGGRKKEECRRQNAEVARSARGSVTFFEKEPVAGRPKGGAALYFAFFLLPFRKRQPMALVCRLNFWESRRSAMMVPAPRMPAAYSLKPAAVMSTMKSAAPAMTVAT